MYLALNFSTGTQHHYTISIRLYVSFDTLAVAANPAFSKSRTSKVTYTPYELKIISWNVFVE
jgi:hypothetical protein